MKIINPATETLIREVKDHAHAEILEKFERAKIAQKSWVEKPVHERVRCIEKFSERLKERIEPLAELLTSEMGKPLHESRNEINGAIKKMKYFIRESQKVLQEETVYVDGATSESIAFDPLGVVVNISAWNYPYLVGINIFIPALICGNAVLYKPSEFTTLTGLEIEKMLHESGVPEAVFQTIVGDGKTGALLVDLDVQGVFFTGSYATGKKISESISSRLLPHVFELGGKDPVYVTEQISDLQSVAEAVAEGCFYNNGQSCCAIERIYVHEKIYDPFIEKLVDATKKLRVGDPLDPAHQQGAIARPVQIDLFESQLKEALAGGGKILCGGKRLGEKGAFFEPTLVGNVNHAMKLMRDETFGPVKGVMRVSDDAEAIQLMNDTEFGLTASVYCVDTDRARKILNQVNAGSSYINCCDRVSGFLPWSGRKHSGFGTSLSYLGLYSFCHPRGVHLRKLN